MCVLIPDHSIKTVSHNSDRNVVRPTVCLIGQSPGLEDSGIVHCTVYRVTSNSKVWCTITNDVASASSLSMGHRLMPCTLCG